MRQKCMLCQRICEGYYCSEKCAARAGRPPGYDLDPKSRPYTSVGPRKTPTPTQHTPPRADHPFRGQTRASQVDTRLIPAAARIVPAAPPPDPWETFLELSKQGVIAKKTMTRWTAVVLENAHDTYRRAIQTGVGVTEAETRYRKAMGQEVTA